MMMTGTAIVAMIAALGWLFLNIRAFRSYNLSFETTAKIVVAWIVIFGGLAFLLSRAGF